MAASTQGLYDPASQWPSQPSGLLSGPVDVASPSRHVSAHQKQVSCFWARLHDLPAKVCHGLEDREATVLVAAATLREVAMMRSNGIEVRRPTRQSFGRPWSLPYLHTEDVQRTAEVRKVH